MERTSFALKANQLDETFRATYLGDAIQHTEAHLLLLVAVVRFLNNEWEMTQQKSITE